MLHLDVALPSGKSERLTLSKDSNVEDLKSLAQQVFGKPFLGKDAVLVSGTWVSPRPGGLLLNFGAICTLKHVDKINDVVAIFGSWQR